MIGRFDGSFLMEKKKLDFSEWYNKGKLTDEQKKALRIYIQWETRSKFRKYSSSLKLVDGKAYKFIGCDIRDKDENMVIICSLDGTKKEIPVRDIQKEVKAYASALERIVEATLDDMKFVQCIMESGKYRIDYSSMKDAISYYEKVNEGQKLPDEMLLLKGFMGAGLPVMECMKKFYTDTVKPSYLDYVRIDALKKQCRIAMISTDYAKKAYESNIFFTKACMSYIKEFNENNVSSDRYVTAEDLSKCRMAAVLFERGIDRIKEVIASSGITLKKFFKSGNVRMCCVATVYGERMATKQEADSVASGAYWKNEFILGEKRGEDFTYLNWAFNGTKTILKPLAINLPEDSGRMARSLAEKISGIIKEWVLSEGFAQDAEKIINSSKPVEYKDSTDDALNIYETLLKIHASGSLIENDSPAIKIAVAIAGSELEKCEKAKSNGRKYKISLTQRQNDVCRAAYEILTGKREMLNENQRRFADDAGIQAMCRKVIDYEKGRQTTIADIAGSVLKYRSCSEKQYNAVKSRYESIQQWENKDRNMVDSAESRVEGVTAGDRGTGGMMPPGMEMEHDVFDDLFGCRVDQIDTKKPEILGYNAGGLGSPGLKSRVEKEEKGKGKAVHESSSKQLEWHGKAAQA